MRSLVQAAAVSLLSLFAAASAQNSPAKPHQMFEVRLADQIVDRMTGKEVSGPFSGRLLISATAAPPGMTAPTSQSGPPTPAQMSAQMGTSAALREPETALIAAMEVENVMPGDVILVDADLIAYPKPFSSLPAGTYYASAVLDQDRNFAYTGYPSDDDLVSAGLTFALPAERPSLQLNRTYLEFPAFPGPANNSADGRMRFAENPGTVERRSHTRDLDFVSPSLSAFYGKETRIRGWVLLPPGYDESAETFPTVFSFPGFGASLNSLSEIALTELHDPMYARPLRGIITPPMIWVLLDHSLPTGTHEFADSANNGPWGKAFTEELIPHLESRYKMDAKPSGRFLTGHSSGGWAALWLQVNYPKLFGGAWPTAPDPTDFRDFTGVNIYAPNANVFYALDGSLRPLVRQPKGVTSFKVYSDFELVRGPVGGQLASFEWVFSPKGADGKPKPLFDRKTGAVDASVAAYWRDNYDIAHYLRTNWARLKPDLDGKIHLTVGTADTYYLDQSARLLQQTLDTLGAKSEFVFLEGKNHGNLSVGEKNALAIYKVARPNSTWTPPPARPRLTVAAPRPSASPQPAPN